MHFYGSLIRINSVQVNNCNTKVHSFKTYKKLFNGVSPLAAPPPMVDDVLEPDEKDAVAFDLCSLERSRLITLQLFITQSNDCLDISITGLTVDFFLARFFALCHISRLCFIPRFLNLPVSGSEKTWLERGVCVCGGHFT